MKILYRLILVIFTIALGVGLFPSLFVIYPLYWLLTGKSWMKRYFETGDHITYYFEQKYK